MDVILISRDGKYRTVILEMKRYGLTVEEAEKGLIKYIEREKLPWEVRVIDKIQRYGIEEVRKAMGKE